MQRSVILPLWVRGIGQPCGGRRLKLRNIKETGAEDALDALDKVSGILRGEAFSWRWKAAE